MTLNIFFTEAAKTRNDPRRILCGIGNTWKD